jgi:preprotein translocase subunit YajC
MFISNAYAADAVSAQSIMANPLTMMIVIMVLFWFMLIRPQMKQAKEHRAMLAALQKGDEVATSGGIVGKVVKVTDAHVSLEVATDIVINVQKHTVQSKLEKGTIKSI